ncbi:ShlB/FhaC/HecB family hemolysin secretion/activation protein [Aureibaculum luteum]|uniref:ShlB/FhaC/HecB family hemolysin secretion/activation protein n=1 Tax=Aureibaculum luteum TaxID=1548456 RepID=UPI0013006B93|nr:ShlB/FhaC/HecB family hemolysin secretion/activation protein [Aureibaculum luteum]
MKQKFTPYIYILFLILFFNHCHGQKTVLNISAIDSTSTLFLRNIHYKKRHFTEKSIFTTLDSIKKEIEKSGFINHNIDSLIKNDSSYTAYFNLKNQIKIIRIYFDNNKFTPFQLIGISEKVTSNFFEVQPLKLTNALQTITNTLEKEGKSFSEVSLKNITIKNDTLIESHLYIKKSTARKIDKVIINGYSNFPKPFLIHKLGIEKNTVFSKQKIDKASSAINFIPFVSELKPSEVLFTKDSTIVYLNLKKENANKFDGLIGFTSKETGKGLSLNGYLDLSLNNLFNSGENLNLTWKNNGNDRQVFNLDISLPYVFNSKLSPYLALNIYKQDSSFVNTLFKFALPYQIDYRNSIGFMLQSESSLNLLSYINSNIEDYSNLFFGLNYNYSIPLNHNIFKTKFNLIIEALAGKRNGITKDNQNKIHLKSNFLWSLNLKNYIFIQNQSGLINSKNLYNNELFRIGGSNSIRGFDEESIFASSYSTFNFEYRYSTNNGSYLYSITDLGYINNNKQTSQLYALGLGYAFTSKLGLINLSYAIGGNSNQAIELNNSRFHLKIINFF